MNDFADGHTKEDTTADACPDAARSGDGAGAAPRGLIRIALRVVVFVVLFYGSAFVLNPLSRWLLQDLAGPTFAVLAAALFASWLSLRIYEARPLGEIGLWLSRNSFDNLALGLAGGAGAGLLAVGVPLAAGAAAIVRIGPPDYPALAFSLLCVAAGSAGEEIFFHGYAFQALLDRLGPWATVLPVGVLFGVMHAGNPGVNGIGIVNTVVFGVVFGYAYVRGRDLWLPIGLHAGWNLVLPLFGADLSGLTMFREATGHELTWRAGALWSGGAYGPEGGLLASLALVPLALYVWKAPVRRQRPAAAGKTEEGASCEPGPRSSS